MSINNCPKAWGPARHFFLEANRATLELGGCLPSERLKWQGKIAAYRLIAIPTGIAAAIASLASMIFSVLLLVATLGTSDKVRSWFSISKKACEASFDLNIKNISELFVLFTGLRGRLIFKDDFLKHMKDGEIIQQAYDLYPPDFTIRSGQQEVLFHKALFRASSLPFLSGLVDNAFKEGLSGESNINLPEKALPALRRFLYTGFASGDPEVLSELIDFSEFLECPNLKDHCFYMLNQHFQDPDFDFKRCLSATVDGTRPLLQNFCFAHINSKRHPDYMQYINELGLDEAFKAYIHQKHDPVNIPSLPKMPFEYHRDEQGDVVFTCKNGEEIRASRLILALRSTQFATLFKESSHAKEVKVDTSQHSKEAVEYLLGLLYEKTIPKFDLNGESIQVWNDFLCCAQEFLESEQVEILKLDFSKLVLDALQNGSIDSVKDLCNNDGLKSLQELAILFNLPELLEYSIIVKLDVLGEEITKQNNPNFKDFEKLGIFDESTYHLTQLRLEKWVYENIKIPPEKRYALNTLILDEIGIKCPLIENLKFFDYFDPIAGFHKSQFENYIRKSSIFQQCPFLKTIKLEYDNKITVVINRP